MVLPFRCRHKGRKRRHERGAECGGRGWAVGRAAHSRTAKSCGPGAPMQALSLREAESFAKATVANAGSPGRARISRKPLRREGRLSPPVPVVIALAQIFFARRPRVHAATRPSLRPLRFGGRIEMQSSGETRRENAESYLSPSLLCEAKQSRLPPRRQSGLLRRFAPRSDGACISLPRHRPRRRAIQYFAASRLTHGRLWNTRSSGQAGR
jgi:hypothetical protein